MRSEPESVINSLPHLTAGSRRHAIIPLTKHEMYWHRTPFRRGLPLISSPPPLEFAPVSFGKGARPVLSGFRLCLAANSEVRVSYMSQTPVIIRQSWRPKADELAELMLRGRYAIQRGVSDLTSPALLQPPVSQARASA